MRESGSVTDGDPLRVLTCDDGGAFLVRLGLALDGIELIETTGVGEAAHIATGERLNAAVVDRTLPDGDGLDLVRRLRLIDLTSEVPIVVLGPDPDLPDAAPVLAAGADEYVERTIEPVELAELVARLSRLTDRERVVRRTVKRARLHAGRDSGGWDDLPTLHE
jgi:DNA-binding response OmpR family regulator